MTSGKYSSDAPSGQRRPPGRTRGLGITLAHAYALAFVVSLILAGVPDPADSRSPPPLFSDDPEDVDRVNAITIPIPLTNGAPAVWDEEIGERTRTSKRFVSTSNPNVHTLEATQAPLHFETVLDSGVFDAEINLTPRRVNNAILDGWVVTDSGFHYALGQPGDKASDGWVGFAGRQGAHAFEFRIHRIGYVHWPTRTFDDIGGAPTYDRSALTRSTDSLVFPDGSSIVISTIATWANLWTTPGGGNVSVVWTASGDGIKEEIVINQAAREWIAANRPPTTPAIDTYFGFVLRVDWNDIPKVVKNGIVQDRDADFNDNETETVEFRDALDRLLGLLPVDSVYVDNRSGDSAPLRKRFYNETGSNFLLTGSRVDRVNALVAGDLIFDPTLDVQVGAGADDTDTETGSWSNSRVRPDCPGRDNSAGSTPCDASFRWTGVNIPQGATITAATFEPHTFPSGDDGPNVFTNIYAEDADNPTAPTSLADFNGRTRTTAFTAWDGQSFADAFTISPDISSVVQEVVDRVGFAGAAFAIFWDDDGSSAPDNHYEIKTYDNAPADGAKLHITFTAPGAVLRFGVFTDAACDELMISTDADCWSATSGGAGGVGVPTFNDNVTLDLNTGTFSRMDANLTVANVSWLNHPFDLTTGGFVFQANGSWSQDSGQINIDVGTPPGGIVVLGDFTLFDSGFILYDESDGFVDVRGNFTLDDEAYIDVSPGFNNALVSVGGNYTIVSVDAGSWDSTNLTVRLNGTADQRINTTTTADLDLLILRNGTKILETDYRGVTLRADAGAVNLTVSNLRTVTLGPSGRIENLTLTSDVFGSQYNLTRSGASIRANNSDFQDANGFFVDASTETGNVDSGNNVNVTFRGIAPLTFLNVTWQQGQPDPGDPRFPQYVFFQPSFGATPVPRVQVVPNNDPFDVFVTLHTASNVTFEICTSEAFNELEFTFDGLTPNRVYRLLRNGVEILNSTTDGAGVWNVATSGESGNWDECPTDVMSLLAVDFPAVVVTVSASATITQAIFRGNLTDLGSPAPVGNFSVFFEWGFSIELGFNTTGVNVSVTGTFTALVDSLEPGITYFFRAVAVEGSNRSEGEIVSFTTGAEPLFSSRDGLILIMLVFIVSLLVLAPIFNIPALWILDGIITILFGIWTFNNLAFPFEFAVAIMALGGVLLSAGVLFAFRLARARRAVV